MRDGLSLLYCRYSVKGVFRNLLASINRHAPCNAAASVFLSAGTISGINLADVCCRIITTQYASDAWIATGLTRAPAETQLDHRKSNVAPRAVGGNTGVARNLQPERWIGGLKLLSLAMAANLTQSNQPIRYCRRKCARWTNKARRLAVANLPADKSTAYDVGWWNLNRFQQREQDERMALLSFTATLD